MFVHRGHTIEELVRGRHVFVGRPQGRGLFGGIVEGEFSAMTGEVGTLEFGETSLGRGGEGGLGQGRDHLEGLLHFPVELHLGVETEKEGEHVLLSFEPSDIDQFLVEEELLQNGLSGFLGSALSPDAVGSDEDQLHDTIDATVFLLENREFHLP